jgi:hypothetical protein
MDGFIQSLWRHPVKGFTPEPLEQVELTQGACFPCDRLFAVEDGPSGFDASAPRHISKQKFTVLAKIAEVARVRTRFDEATGTLTAEAPGRPPIQAVLTGEQGRQAFAAWLTETLGEEARGPLKVLPAPGVHRFMDDVQGFVSIINLASVRDLEARIGRAVDPLRFRANLYVEGWRPWAENAFQGEIRLGGAVARTVKPIVRCLATHVDPKTGERDLDVTRSLFDAYGHTLCGVYVAVVSGGRVKAGDVAASCVSADVEAPLAG